MKISPNKARELRERAMLSQDELAEAVGVSGFTVWRWEHGEDPVGVRPKAARKLHEVLGAQPGELLAGKEPSTPLAEVPPLELEVMYTEPDEDARRRALDAADNAEVAAYVAKIDQVRRDVLGGIPEYEERAADEALPERQREAARAARDALWRHIGHLLLLRDEATGEDYGPPTQEEVHELVAHAGVA